MVAAVDRIADIMDKARNAPQLAGAPVIPQGGQNVAGALGCHPGVAVPVVGKADDPQCLIPGLDQGADFLVVADLIKRNHSILSLFVFSFYYTAWLSAAQPAPGKVPVKFPEKSRQNTGRLIDICS